MFNISKGLKNVASPIKSLWRAFDLRDAFFMAGWLMLGEGIRQKWGLWLALMICGILMMVTAYLMRGMPK